MKISYIMQSYLGEYPTSASDRVLKFKRAIESFLSQTYINSELVIVSDMCDATKDIYYNHYKGEDRVKFIFIDKDPSEKMYASGKYYRGYPRQIGRCIASGDIITYIDSDDYILPTAAEELAKMWKLALSQKQYGMCINLAWFDNVKVDVNDPVFNSLEIKGNPMKIKHLESEWVHVRLKQGMVAYITASISHVANNPIKWEDTKGPNTEDYLFGKRSSEFYENNVFYIDVPIHTRCHASEFWDY